MNGQTIGQIDLNCITDYEFIRIIIDGCGLSPPLMWFNKYRYFLWSLMLPLRHCKCNVQLLDGVYKKEIKSNCINKDIIEYAYMYVNTYAYMCIHIARV